jgi:uncharacterized Fe-S radical SAM superfamily protein PflX
MKLDPPIKAEWFYKDEKEKTKINWFCFEYALEFYTFIMKSEALQKYRKRNSREEIAAFCTHFAKQMKKSVYDKLARITPVVIIDEEYIASYYPKNTQRQNKVFIEVAGEAWDNLLSACEVCPVRCISEREKRSDFFDRYEKGGYLGGSK